MKNYLIFHIFSVKILNKSNTLKIEKYRRSNCLSMKLKKIAPFINETSIKKTNLMEKNKFYLNPY